MITTMSTTTTVANRILVHFMSRETGGAPQMVQFSQCLLGLCRDEKKKENTSIPGSAFISCELNNLSLNITATPPERGGVLLQHPPFCPMMEISQEGINKLPKEISCRGVDVGVVALLQSLDNKILLTRRAAHMRTFPNTWVPPGGHIEAGETLGVALAREVKEETGISIDGCKESLLCAWESVYPYNISMGQPKRHHLVLYYLIKLQKFQVEVDKEIELDNNEVGGCCWIDKYLATIITGANKVGMEELKSQYIDIQSYNIDMKEWDSIKLSSTVFLAEAPAHGPDIERVSTGTRFALQQWIKTMNG